MADEEIREVPAFACCSIGIGRWFWAAWSNEEQARSLATPLATGYEKSAAQAEARATERLGGEVRRLPSKWASAFKRGGGEAGAGTGESRPKPKSRLSRPKGSIKRSPAPPRLAFLYSAIAREPPDALGHVTVTRHRIVKQGPRKIHVEADPFDEDEWARRSETSEGSPEPAPKPRTLAVDRFELRKEGRFVCARAHDAPTFYASEEDGVRDVEAALTAKYAWCAVLGVRFPCSTDDVKSAFRRLATASHPDRGGDPTKFHSVERAYRAALAYFAKADDANA